MHEADQHHPTAGSPLRTSLAGCRFEFSLYCAFLHQASGLRALDPMLLVKANYVS